MAGSSVGSAVLIHGAWGQGADWRWVRAELEGLGVQVQTPDLPSAGDVHFGFEDDVAETRRAIRACAPPVVLVGWSYGGRVIGVAADGEPAVCRLLFVATTPSVLRTEEEGSPDTDWVLNNPDMDFLDDGGILLRDEALLADESLFPDEIRAHLRQHPRRPMSPRGLTDPVTAEAWRSVPSTLLLGRQDDLMSPDEVQEGRDLCEDVRFVDCDHFILWRRPEEISRVVAEALGVG